MAGKVYMVMALIMMGFVLQACNGMNVDVDDGDDIKPTEDSRFFCFRKIQDSFVSESVPLDVANKTSLVTKNVCQNVVSHDDLLNQQHLHHHRPPPKMAGRWYMVMALIMMGFVLQACNGMNVDVDDGDDIKPTEDSRFFASVCSIRCGKQNKPCYQKCLPKCGLPRRLAKPTTSPSSPSSTV
ncbi:hypothetical protein HID58_007908 [Brassica napus]|uniref:Uncharacterized protein n=1 Tax=Brassica napus TaxID=3708 RepID=A0ABQ7XK00_BRANA|nr:hypothetical protein HID58_007908 [Brassica napus]